MNNSAFFVFEQTTPRGERKEFVFEVSDATRIAEARAILADPHSTKVHIQGKIIAKPAPYNPGWSFHLDPTSIGFFEMQIEACDANVAHVEDHLDEVGGSFLPHNFWCPWSSKLIGELTAMQETLLIEKDRPGILPAESTPFAVDFESFVHEELIHLPWTYGAITISAIGGNYLPLIFDASRSVTVLGPRSMGLPTRVSNSYMKLTFEVPQVSIWLSLIKVDATPVAYSVKNADDQELSKGTLSFSGTDPNGTYRTFFVDFRGAAKSIDFSGGGGFLSRIAGRSQ